MSKFVTALFGAAILLAGVPALAASTSNDMIVATKVVRTHDLDLYSERGRRMLDRRIENAARQVCREDRTGLTAVANPTCFRDAVASARTQRDRLFAARGLIANYRSAQAKR